MKFIAENERAINPFSFLGKYVQRQEENYLTLVLCFLFNTCQPFRISFIELLSSLSRRFKERISTIDPSLIQCIPQLPFKRNRTVGYFDLAFFHKELPNEKSKKLIAIIEAKVESQFGVNQLKKYRAFNRNVQLFVLTKYLTSEGSIGYGQKIVPRFRWFDVYDALKCSYIKSRGIDRYLIEKGIYMLADKGLATPDLITIKTWKSFDKALSDTTRLRKNASEIFRGLSIIVDRLVLFRNSVWSSLEEEGWKPFVNYHRDSEIDCGKYHSFEAGYYKYKKGARNFREKGIYIELYKDQKHHKEFVLCLNRYRKHVETGFKDDSKTFRLDTTRNCFTLPFSEALKIVEKEMSLFLSSFKRSNDYKALK